MPKQQKDTIFIASTIAIPWGGCEDLWSQCVPILQNQGYHVAVFKYQVDDHPKITRHKQDGVEFFATLPRRRLPERVFSKIRRKLKERLRVKEDSPEFRFGYTEEVRTFSKYLSKYPVKLALISQGANFEGLGYAYACMKRNIPYVVVSHKAIDFYWPPVDHREGMRKVLANAKGCYFVSQHNKRLTEEQFGVRLPESRVIFNPVKPTQHIPYPATIGFFHLVCIGRLFLIEKGQDILIRALSHEKWKNRPIKVSIVGSGPDKDVLSDMVKLLGVTNISFCGEVSDIYEVWKRAHALVLPSRTEGLPLVIVEAMMAGRPVITTDVGGNKEFLEEGVTGFIGDASDVSFEQTLERAWQQRDTWKAMGDQAAISIRKIIPAAPEQIFAGILQKHMQDS